MGEVLSDELSCTGTGLVICLLNEDQLVKGKKLFMKLFGLTLLHSERPKLHTILAFLSAIGLRVDHFVKALPLREPNRKSQEMFLFVKMVEKLWYT